MRTPTPLRWLALSVVFVFLAPLAAVRAQCPDPATPVNLALIDMERAARTSGAAMSQAHDGLFWLVNDGTDARINGFDLQGRWRVSLIPEPLTVVDMTDIAVRDGWVYILDNHNDALRVLRFREPTRLPDGEPVESPAWGEDAPRPPEMSVDVETMRVRRSPMIYSGAMFVDDSGEIYLISSGEHATVYSVGRFGHAIVPREVSRLDIPQVTGADLSADGHAIVVRSASRALLFRSAETNDIARLLDTPCPASLGPEQREGAAVMFSRDSGRYYTLSKGRTSVFECRIP